MKNLIQNQRGTFILEASLWSAVILLVILVCTKNFLFSYQLFLAEVQKQSLPLRQ